MKTLPPKITFKRFKRRITSKKKQKLKRININITNLQLKSELGKDKSLLNQFDSWLPESIKYIFSKLGENKMEYADKNVDLKNNYRIFVPKTFCLINNPTSSYNFIYSLLLAILSDLHKNVIVDYSKCKKIELSAQIFLDIILKDTIKFLKRRARYKSTQPYLSHIQGININSSDIKKILFSIGSPAIINKVKFKFEDIIPYNLCVHNKGINSVKNNHRKEIDTTELVEHIITSLNAVGKKLNPENKDDLSTVVGEVLINAEEHSTINYRYSTGYFQKIQQHDGISGIYHLVIMNFGETIYEKFKSPDCQNFDIIDKMKNLSSKYITKRWFTSNFEEETLWTLYALQEGITSVSTEKYRRGNGSIRFIESFFNLKQNTRFKDKISNMVIMSGNTIIKFDGTYTVENKTINGEAFNVMTFNKSGNLEDKPDKKFVKFVPEYFPGTIFSAKILITQDDITNEPSNN